MLCSGGAQAEASPEPAAAAAAAAGASAAADAAAAADPQYYPGAVPLPGVVGGVGVSASRPPYNPSACELTNQCCGMANSQCCVGGQRCYTVWERKCDQEDNPECR